MIKVYINHEYYISFENQAQFDHWFQTIDASDYGCIEIEYNNEEER